MDFKLLTNPSHWCLPAFIYALFIGYVIIVTLSLEGNLPNGQRITMKEKILTALGEALWGVIILYIMLMLCKNHHDMWAWAILLAPIVIHMIRKA